MVTEHVTLGPAYNQLQYKAGNLYGLRGAFKLTAHSKLWGF